MITLLLWVFWSIVILTGAECDAQLGAQQGKYANLSNKAHAILPDTGLIEIARGASLTHDVGIEGGVQNLLYVLIVCPGLQAELTGGGSNIDTFTSGYSYIWSTGAGNISVSYTWDRRTDTLHIAGADYNRAKGNAFVLRRDPATGHWSAQQLANIDPRLNAAEALRAIKSQTAGDPVISSLRTYPGT